MNTERLVQVEKLLRSPALNIRVAAVNELAQEDSGVAVPVLARLAADPDFLYRRLAVMGLGNHPVTESLEVLEGLLLSEEDSNVVAEAANSLMEFGEAGIVRLAQLFRENENWLVRQTVLGVMMDGDRSTMLFDVVRLGLADPVVATRETAILALGKFVGSEFQEEAMVLLLEIAESGFGVIGGDRRRRCVGLGMSGRRRCWGGCDRMGVTMWWRRRWSRVTIEGRVAQSRTPNVFQTLCDRPYCLLESAINPSHPNTLPSHTPAPNPTITAPQITLV